ncbi:MAG: hypothetical protein U1F36_19585 [Planctomycetota bacterium]
MLVATLVAFALLQQDPPTLFDHVPWRGIGPGNMSGRIAAIDASNRDWRTVLVGSASGGVFLSHNAGTTWTPIFDHYGSGSIGAVALFQPDPMVIWVGTGEANNRNSAGWGDGIYRSIDGGQTFTNLGLRDTRQIADIAVHPSDRDIAYVAAVGSLWGESGSRGLYKTVDGGAHWTLLEGGLPKGVGCTEVVVHPTEPDTLFCGMYERRRSPWWMHSGGPNGGMFKSTDGGATWRKLTDGLPTGDTGMIDIDICLSQPDCVVAQVEAAATPSGDLAVPGPGIYRSDDGGESWRYLLRTALRPFYHGQVAIDPSDPQRIYSVGREFKVSKDGGRTWVNRWWSGGGDDHDLWISPQDGAIRYMATDQGAHLTIDDGTSVLAFENLAVGQYYAIGVDLSEPYRIVGGLQDNGLWLTPSNSRDPHGILNAHSSWVGEGDGFHAQIDQTDNRTAYLVNHVGFAARVDLVTREHAYITPTPETIVDFAKWFDPTFPETATRYTILPGEHWFFGAQPDRPRLPPQFRFNWSSPLILSPHDQSTVYFGGNHLFESRDRGVTWRIVSPDLTTNDPSKRNPTKSGGLTNEVTGGENHCTIITIAVSPLDARELWCGTDDGNVQITRDGGAHWSNVRTAIQAATGAPREGAWISRVEPSHVVAGRCYVTLDDHRRDDYRPYLFVTEDFGATFRSITSNLPDDGSAYVVREDARNPDLLFVGTEFGAFASLDRGASWSTFGRGLPTVAVHDLVIHPRDRDLVAGTHGRALWIADDITGLEECTPDVRAQDLVLLRPRPAIRWDTVDWGRRQPSFLLVGENPERGTFLHVWSRNALEDKVTIRVTARDGSLSWSRQVSISAGLNRVRWPLVFGVDAQQIATARDALLRAADEIRTHLRSDELRTRIDEIVGRLKSAGTVHELNAARHALVEDFAGYAAGEPTFGERLDTIDAPAGTYLVTLESGDTTRHTEVVVRDDPLGTSGR